jgi:hypothetical protein
VIDFIRVLSLLGLVSVAMGMEHAYFWYKIGCWNSHITSHETLHVRASDCVCRCIDTLILIHARFHASRSADAGSAAQQEADKPSPVNSVHHHRPNNSNSKGNVAGGNVTHGRVSGAEKLGSTPETRFGQSSPLARRERLVSGAQKLASTPETRIGARGDRQQASVSPASTRRKWSCSTDRTSLAKSSDVLEGGFASPGSRGESRPTRLSLSPHRSREEMPEESGESEPDDGDADDITALVLERSNRGGARVRACMWEWVGRCGLCWRKVEVHMYTVVCMQVQACAYVCACEY